MKLRLIGLLLCFGATPVATHAQSTAPNIVLVLTDDQGWGSTSVLMNEAIPESKSDFIKTPHLEKLADRGVIFSQAYAPHPNCSPSRYSILTGKSPAKLQMSDIVGRHDGPFFQGNRSGTVSRANPFLVFHFPHYQLEKGGQPATALYMGDYKLIKFWETGDYHLYNLKSDLEERNDLAQKETNQSVKLSLMLNDYLATIRAGIPAVNSQFDPDNHPGKKHEDTKARLMTEPYFITH